MTTLDNFFSKGFQIFDGKKYHDQLFPLLGTTKFENFTGDEYHPSENIELIEILLLQIHLEIASDIVENFFQQYTILHRKTWESVNKKATNWHNDFKDHSNTFFLLYHNQTSEATGGAVYFRYNGIEEKIYPKPGTLIFFNSENGYEHKAENSTSQRIVSSFYFDIPNNYVY